MRRIASAAALCALLTLIVPGSAAAQARFDGTVFAGGAFFLSDLTPEFNGLVQSHDNGFGLGAHAGVRLSTVSIEGTLAYVPTEITTKIVSGGPSGEVSADQNILMLTANVLYNIPINFNWEAFLGAGAGIKSYSADDPLSGVPACGGGSEPCPPGFTAGSSFTFSVGGGFRLNFSDNWSARLDLRDYISSFDGFAETSQKGEMTRTQHDVLATIGLSFSPR